MSNVNNATTNRSSTHRTNDARTPDADRRDPTSPSPSPSSSTPLSTSAPSSNANKSDAPSSGDAPTIDDVAPEFSIKIGGFDLFSSSPSPSKASESSSTPRAKSASGVFQDAKELTGRTFVTDNACKAFVKDLRALPAKDAMTVLNTLDADERKTLFENLPNNERRVVVDLAAKAGVVDTAPVQTGDGWGTPPKAPTLLVNDTKLAPEWRALIHDENCARAATFNKAHGKYCDAYKKEILDVEPREEVGARIRSNPVATSALPSIEPGTKSDGPLSTMRSEWKAAVGKNHDTDVIHAKATAMATGRSERDKSFSIDFTAKVKVNDSNSLATKMKFNAAGDVDSMGINANAGTKALSVSAEKSIDKEGTVSSSVTVSTSKSAHTGGFNNTVGGGVTFSDDGNISVNVDGRTDAASRPSSVFRRDGVDSSLASSKVTFKGKEPVAGESSDPLLPHNRRARIESANAERTPSAQAPSAQGDAISGDGGAIPATYGGSIGGTGLTISNARGGTVEASVLGATMSVSQDGHAVVGQKIEIGENFELSAMVSVETAHFAMDKQLAAIDDVRTEDVPTKLLEKFEWNELPASSRDSLKQELWTETEWNTRRSHALTARDAQNMKMAYRR